MMSHQPQSIYSKNKRQMPKVANSSRQDNKVADKTKRDDEAADKLKIQKK